MLRSSWNAFNTKDSTNGKNPTRTFKIQRLDLGVKKLGISDIDWSNPYGNKATHFIGCIESLNAVNSPCNHKKIGATSEAIWTMHVSFTNEGKTQVGSAIIIGEKMWKWINANNTPPKGSPCHVPNLNEMTVRSPCLEVSKKYSGNRCA